MTMTAAVRTEAALAPVVIVGAGLAGLTVALHLADRVPVIVLAKRELNEAATAWAQGGIVGVLGSDDRIASAVRDSSHCADASQKAFSAPRKSDWCVCNPLPFCP